MNVMRRHVTRVNTWLSPCRGPLRWDRCGRGPQRINDTRHALARTLISRAAAIDRAATATERDIDGRGTIRSFGRDRSGGEPDDVWVIDPIDGTANFARGLPLWAVSIGLLRKRQPVAAEECQPVERLHDEFLVHAARPVLEFPHLGVVTFHFRVVPLQIVPEERAERLAQELIQVGSDVFGSDHTPDATTIPPAARGWAPRVKSSPGTTPSRSPPRYPVPFA